MPETPAILNQLTVNRFFTVDTSAYEAAPRAAGASGVPPLGRVVPSLEELPVP